jgi:CBS domain-containing protein
MVHVGEVMNREVRPIGAEMTVAELAAHIGGKHSAGRNAEREPAHNVAEGLPIVGQDGRLCGIITQGDLLKALERDPEGKTSVLQAGSGQPIVAYPDEPAQSAMYRMLENNIGRLPVVSREEPAKIVGYFNRSSLLSAWSRQVHEEGVREHGWIRSWRTGRGRFAMGEK